MKVTLVIAVCEDTSPTAKKDLLCVQSDQTNSWIETECAEKEATETDFYISLPWCYWLLVLARDDKNLLFVYSVM